MKQASFASSSVQGGGKRRAEGMELSRRLRSWLPLACELLRLGDLRRGHVLRDFVANFHRILDVTAAADKLNHMYALT